MIIPTQRKLKEKKMTKNKIINTLKKNGINISAIHSVSCDEIEILVEDGKGDCDEIKTKEAAKDVAKILGWDGSGFYSGYGSFVMRKNYAGIEDDYNSTDSRHHY